MKNTINEYKEYEFGIIPKDWEIKKIGEIFDDLKGGSTPSRKIEKYYTGNIPWITSGELKYKTIYSTVENITEEAVSDTNLKIYVEGTFFIAITGLEAEGTRGSCAITGVKATTNQSCMAFQPKNNFSNLYLYYWYCLYGDYIGLQYTQGTKQQSLNNKIVSDIEIPVPQLKEQQKIVSILSSIDEKIEITDNIIEKTKELKKGLMQKLLTKGIGHERFKDTEIGRIPEEWEVGILSDVIDKNRRITYGIVQPGEYDENGKYLIRAKDYSFGWVDNSEIFRVSDDIEKSYARARVEYGDVLLTIVGSVGNLAVVPKRLNNSNITQQTARLAFNNQVGSNIYYYNYFQSFIGKKEISRYLKTGVQPSLNLSDVEKFEIIIPALKEQQKISLILSSVDEKIEQYEVKKEKLQELKKGLMQKLLTGKIRVK